MRRVPKSFQLGNHTIAVQQVTVDEMARITKDDDCYGYFEPDSLTIYVLRPTRKLKSSVVLQTFWHEVSHAILWAISHKDYGNEKVVDAMGNALAQITTTFKN